MEIEPASFDQIRVAADGRLVNIAADIGGVAESIRRLDPCLHLKYSERGECFIVYRVHRDGMPCRLDDPERTEELVLTALECDQRIVKRLEFIDPQGRGGYDYAQALEDVSRRAKRLEREAFREHVGGAAEEVAHEIRKAEGSPYRGRVFVPRGV